MRQFLRDHDLRALANRNRFIHFLKIQWRSMLFFGVVFALLFQMAYLANTKTKEIIDNSNRNYQALEEQNEKDSATQQLILCLLKAHDIKVTAELNIDCEKVIEDGAKQLNGGQSINQPLVRPTQPATQPQGQPPATSSQVAPPPEQPQPGPVRRVINGVINLVTGQ